MTPEFLLVKLLRTLATMWLVVSLAFLILRLSGDPVTALVGIEAAPEVVAHYHERFGLDRPLSAQYFSYVASVLQGDLGISFSDESPALQIILDALPRTLQLGSIAFALTLVIGLPMGIVAALNRNKPVDRLVMSFAVFGFSIPNFFLGILLILLFSLHLRLLPSSGSGDWQHLLMPAFTLGTAGAGTIARFARSSMLEVLSRPYMRTAFGKGLPLRTSIRRHALPNAILPVVTVIGLELGQLVAGATITETVFAWPGVGRLLVSSVTSRDLAVVQAILLMVGLTMTLANLCVDLTYAWIDPRIRVRASDSDE